MIMGEKLYIHVSHEKKPWFVGLYRGLYDYTTQLYREYNKPL